MSSARNSIFPVDLFYFVPPDPLGLVGWGWLASWYRKIS